ncbi:MAG: signal peptidase I [bacterium]|nr:signal peptidase I [bacterium]
MNQNREIKRKSIYREYLEAIVIAIALALVIRTFVVQAFKIPSGSMIPTLLIGDHILVNKFIYRFEKPERGDIIVFKYPQDPSRDFIKRLIGKPGDTLEIRNKQVFINGKPLYEPYVIHEGGEAAVGLSSVRDNYGPITIPEGYFFVMGDNRDCSLDSRFWGLLPEDMIKGKAFIIYWSWDAESNWVRWSRFAKILH